MPLTAQRLLLAFLALLGAFYWVATTENLGMQVLPVGGASILACVVGVVVARVDKKSLVLRNLESLRLPTANTRRRMCVAVFLTSVVVLLAEAIVRHRSFDPLFHDEFAYLLQSRMLATGRLWTAAHPLADFFETFFVIGRPVYATIYFPGNALINVPTIWLNLPTWIIPLVISSAIPVFFFLIATELIDGWCGLLAAGLVISLPVFRGTSIMVISHPTMQLLGLAMIYSWLRWRNDRRLLWAFAIGVMMGWAAITRPLDALGYALVIGIALLIDLRKSSLRKAGMMLAMVAVGILPFLSLQIIFDLGTTGHPFTTPYLQYLERELPQSSYHLRQPPFDPSAHSASAVPQKQRYYSDFLQPIIKQFDEEGIIQTTLRDRLPLITGLMLPNRILAILIAIGLLGLTDTRRAAVWAIGPVMVALFAFNPIFLNWYTVPWLAPVLFGILLAIDRTSVLFPLRGFTRAALFALVFAFVILSLFSQDGAGENLRAEVIESIHNFDRSAGNSRKLLIINVPETFNYHQYPIFNCATVSIDDATVIHARDLGVVRDRELVEYYASRQPDRDVLTIDLATGDTHDWGRADEALKQWPK